LLQKTKQLLKKLLIIRNIDYIYTIKQIQMTYTLDKYKQNLKVINDDVWSYNTRVGIIAGTKLFQLGYWSQTTQKHINYVADQYDLDLIKP